MERPNLFEALTTAVSGAEEDFLGAKGDTVQGTSEDPQYDPDTAPDVTMEDTGIDPAPSGEDDTSDEEFQPPSESDDESPEDMATEESDEADEGEGPSGTPHTMTAKDGTDWHEVPVTKSGKTRSKNIFKKPPTQIPRTQHVHDPYDAFKLFVSDKIIDDVVKYTNLYGHQVHGQKWVPCDHVEMEALIGALLYLGSRKQNMMGTADIWDCIDGVNLVRACMSRKRFQNLTQCLRFDDKASRSARRARDPFAPFREIWDEFNTNLSRYYIAGPLLTIDEQLVPFRGRCSFLQYLPSKPDRYGIKVFWVADAENNFPLLGIPYLGRPLGQERQVDLGRKMALDLSKPFFKSGRNITCDNYFTDLVLAETCLKNGLTVVGTVRTNRRFLPIPFKSNKALALHASKFVYRESTTLVSYQSKRNKNTVVLSTMHDKGVVEETARKRKPEMILFYNSTKGAVDALDQMAHSFTSKRKTKRWPMVMFSNTMDLATIAARCVYRIKFAGHSLGAADSRGAFNRNISKHLMFCHLQRRSVNKFLPRDLSNLMQKAITDIGGETAVPGTSQETRGATGDVADAPAPRKRQRCAHCPWKLDRKTQQRCVKCSTFICPRHTLKVCPSCANPSQ